VIADWHGGLPRLVIGCDHRVFKRRPISLRLGKTGPASWAGPSRRSNLRDQRGVQYKKLATGFFTL